MATNPAGRPDPARERAAALALAVGYRKHDGAQGAVLGVPAGRPVAVPAQPGRVDKARGVRRRGVPGAGWFGEQMRKVEGNA